MSQKALAELWPRPGWRASREGKVGNEELWVSPIPTIVGCSYLTAQETVPSALSFMSPGKSNHSLSKS